MHSEDEKLMRFSMDFIGIQNYTREVVRFSRFIPHVNARLVKADHRNVATTTMNWEVYPQGIFHVLKRMGAYEGVRKIIVTENGAAFKDELIDGKINDKKRVAFLENYLQQVLLAKNDGVPVHGNFVWSFTDNFEWAEGFQQRFGLVYVDYSSQRRYIKSSGHWFREFLHAYKGRHWNKLLNFFEVCREEEIKT